MTLRELLQVVDGDIYIIGEDEAELCMINPTYCEFEYVINDKLLDEKVLCVYIHDGKLKVITNA